ncbi:MAG: hypothetical protein PVJ86_10550, partial [Phycisphaerales bacterium]
RTKYFLFVSFFLLWIANSNVTQRSERRGPEKCGWTAHCLVPVASLNDSLYLKYTPKAAKDKKMRLF